MDNATKLLFARLDEINKQLARLDVLEQKISELDPNGKLDEIKYEMRVVAANSQVVINTVEGHGENIRRLEKTLTRLDLRCPLMKPSTDEFPSVIERRSHEK